MAGITLSIREKSLSGLPGAGGLDAAGRGGSVGLNEKQMLLRDMFQLLLMHGFHSLSYHSV